MSYYNCVDAYYGNIAMVGFNYVPSGWAYCNGSVLSLSQNEALYSLLMNNFYGGSYPYSFALPDLRGRIPVYCDRQTNQFYDIGRSNSTKTWNDLTMVSAAQPGQDDTTAPATTDNKINKLPPYTSLNFIIALTGVYPSRSW